MLADSGRSHSDKKEGRTYRRPVLGTLESPQKDAFDAPQVGARSNALFASAEVSKVSGRTAAEATRKRYLVVREWIRAGMV